MLLPVLCVQCVCAGQERLRGELRMTGIGWGNPRDMHVYFGCGISPKKHHRLHLVCRTAVPQIPWCGWDGGRVRMRMGAEDAHCGEADATMAKSPVAGGALRPVGNLPFANLSLLVSSPSHSGEKAAWEESEASRLMAAVPVQAQQMGLVMDECAGQEVIKWAPVM